MSLWSFAACWQWADRDKSLDRWKLTRCDYPPQLEFTVHQSRQPRGLGLADSVVARDSIFFMIQWLAGGGKKKKKSQMFFKYVVILNHFFYWDSDSQILIKCRSLRGIITSTYALTPSLNTYLDYHLTFYGFLSSSCLPSCLSDRLLPSPHAACSGPETNSKTTEWATGEMEDGTEQRERERHGKRVCVKNHILSAECHLEVER